MEGRFPFLYLDHLAGKERKCFQKLTANYSKPRTIQSCYEIYSARRGGIGGVFRDTRDHWLQGYMGNTLEPNNIKTKLLALMHGLKWAIKHKLRPFEISVDCSDIILLIKNNIESKYLSIAINCKNLLQQLGNPPN